MDNTGDLQQKCIIEKYEQQMHELRTRLLTAQMMEQEYMSDLEALKKRYETEQAESAAKVKALEEKCSLLLKESSHKIECLEEKSSSEVADYKRQIAELQEKVNSLEERLEQRNETSSADVRKFQAENAELYEREKEQLMKYQQLAEKVLQHRNKLEEMTCKFNETNECLLAKKEDLASCMDSLQGARDELALVKSELEMLKSNPALEGQKGNSLFAEVEDRRQVLKENLQKAVNKYRHMKKLYLDKCAEVSKNRADYFSLSEKLQELQFMTTEQEAVLTKAHKMRIKELEEEVENLRRQKPPYIINCSDDDTLKFMESYVESSRKECNRLKEELEAHSVRALLKSEELVMTQKRLQRSEANLQYARAKIAELQEFIKGKQIAEQQTASENNEV